MVVDTQPHRWTLSRPEFKLDQFVIDVATIQWSYFGLVVAFTICLALLLPLTKSSGLKWWLLSNLFTATAIPMFILRPVITHNVIAFLLPTTLVVIAAALKLVAMSSFRMRQRLKWPIIALISFFVMCYVILDHADLLTLRLVLALSVLSILTVCIAFAIAQNKSWEGLRGRGLLIVSFATSGIFFVLVAVRSIVEPSTAAYFSQGPAQSRTFALNIVQVIAVHIGFIAIMVGRLSKLSALKSVRQQENIRRRQIAEKHAAEMENIAIERRALLDLLSHEVRQPLHNAQAALQEISRQIGEVKVAQLHMKEPVHRLFDIIDGVVLALSNAIVGASVIERRAEQDCTDVDVTAIVELAHGDCSMADQARVMFNDGAKPIFVRGDPVLLRLAVRNLLDNALKFSPPDSIVAVSVKLDPIRFGVSICVINETLEIFSPGDHVFERDWRGSKSKTLGKGLGLFIVREVAQIHHGSAKASLVENGRTCFEIFIPV